MKTRTFKLYSLLAVLGLGLSGAAQSALIDRGGGLIYDDVLDVTWLQDANYAKTSGYDTNGKMDWSAANTWAANLSYGGYNDWRLADVRPVNNTAFQYSLAFDGTTDIGYNISSTQSELGYMFYQNLGNTGYFDTNGIPTDCLGTGLCLSNTGLFDNLESFAYWTAVEYAPNTNSAWASYTNVGLQKSNDKSREYFAWAVRTGDVAPVSGGDVGAVPVPAAAWLMGGALLGLVGVTRKR